MGSFRVFTSHQIPSGWSNESGSYGQGIWYAWKEGDTLVGFWWESMNEGDNLEDLAMEGPWTVISHCTHTTLCADYDVLCWTLGRVTVQSCICQSNVTWQRNSNGKYAVWIFSDTAQSAHICSPVPCVLIHLLTVMWKSVMDKFWERRLCPSQVNMVWRKQSWLQKCVITFKRLGWYLNFSTRFMQNVLF